MSLCTHRDQRIYPLEQAKIDVVVTQLESRGRQQRAGYGRFVRQRAVRIRRRGPSKARAGLGAAVDIRPRQRYPRRSGYTYGGYTVASRTPASALSETQRAVTEVGVRVGRTGGYSWPPARAGEPLKRTPPAAVERLMKIKFMLFNRHPRPTDRRASRRTEWQCSLYALLSIFTRSKRYRNHFLCTRRYRIIFTRRYRNHFLIIFFSRVALPKSSFSFHVWRRYRNHFLFTRRYRITESSCRATYML